MSHAHQFHPRLRMVLCQTLAMIGFLVFLGLMQSRRPVDQKHRSDGPPEGSAAIFVGATRGTEEEDEEKQKAEEKKPVREAEKKPRRPERFRPSSRSNDAPTRGPEFPPEAAGRPEGRKAVKAPPRDLPLSYLMKFNGMEDFHSFLDDLPETQDDARTMSLIRIEGLPRSEDRMRKLFESYRMQPFLFNPDRFNYLITGDMRLLKDKRAIDSYIARVGRYLRQQGENAAYDRVKEKFVEKARSNEGVRRTLAAAGEFERMHLGLASPHLTAFLRRLERDTVRQVSELTGRDVSVRDIARIDCRFREVNGALVLVPRQAHLGTGHDGPVEIWRN